MGNKARLIVWGLVLLQLNNLLGPALSKGGLWNRARLDVSNFVLYGLVFSNVSLRTTFFLADPLGLLTLGLLYLGLLPLGLLPFLVVGFL